MSNYRIVCTEQTGCNTGGHIVGVGTGDDPGSASGQCTVAEVYRFMDLGHTFYTYADGKVATVHKIHCGCGFGTLRSSADATVANNLDNLRVCGWAA